LQTPSVALLNKALKKALLKGPDMDRTLTPVTSIDDGFAGWNVPTEDDDLHDLDDDLSLLREDFAHVEHPLIGCVIPAYNEESTIGDVIQSLLDQTLTPDEIHVVINNSNDRTLQKPVNSPGCTENRMPSAPWCAPCTFTTSARTRRRRSARSTTAIP
jgi:hypothetical protein